MESLMKDRHIISKMAFNDNLSTGRGFEMSTTQPERPGISSKFVWQKCIVLNRTTSPPACRIWDLHVTLSTMDYLVVMNDPWDELPWGTRLGDSLRRQPGQAADPQDRSLQ